MASRDVGKKYAYGVGTLLMAPVEATIGAGKLAYAAGRLGVKGLGLVAKIGMPLYAGSLVVKGAANRYKYNVASDLADDDRDINDGLSALQSGHPYQVRVPGTDREEQDKERRKKLVELGLGEPSLGSIITGRFKSTHNRMPYLEDPDNPLEGPQPLKPPANATPAPSAPAPKPEPKRGYAVPPKDSSLF